jgi:hypothetical protein
MEESVTSIVTIRDSTVRIMVGGGMDFHIPRKAYDEALTMATLQRKVWFVGIMPNGAAEVHPIRQELLDKGCEQVAWITPSGVR